MVKARTLPIRVAPVAGEALDSWLEAISIRLDTPLRIMIKSLGLTRHSADKDTRAKPPDWTIYLEPAEAEHLREVTGVSVAALHAMTLRPLHPRIVDIDLSKRTVSRNTVWGTTGSRFCGRCLADTGGRWQLNWRLSWTFACTAHQRLMGDLCLQCHRKPRTIMSPLVAVPMPARCAMPRPGAVRNLATPRCGQPLTAIDTMTIDGHVLAAQQALHQLISDPSAQQRLFPLYPPEHTGTRQLLHDLKVVAAKVINHAADTDLNSFAGTDLIAAMRDYLHRHGGRRPGAQPPRDAATTAIALTIAVQVLQAPDHATAVDRISWLLQRTSMNDAIALERISCRASSPPPSTRSCSISSTPIV